MVFVEFMGLPGAGKTTLAASLQDRLRARGTDCIDRRLVFADEKSPIERHLRRARFAILAMLRRPDLLVTGARLVRRSRQRSRRDAAKVLWNLSCVLGFSLWYRNRRVGAVIVDQGLLQACWSIAFSGQAPVSFAPLLARVTSAQTRFVLVVASGDEADARLRQRKNGNTRLTPARAGAAGDWPRAETALNRVLADLERLVSPERILRVDNRSPTDPATLGRDLADWLDASVAASPPGGAAARLCGDRHQRGDPT
jgi:hypothetical protein